MYLNLTFVHATNVLTSVWNIGIVRWTDPFDAINHGLLATEVQNVNTAVDLTKDRAHIASINWNRCSKFDWNRFRSSVTGTTKGSTFQIDSTRSPFDFDVTILSEMFTPWISNYPIWNVLFSTPSDYQNKMIWLMLWIAREDLFLASLVIGQQVKYFYTSPGD